jgi:hypothetical protein
MRNAYKTLAGKTGGEERGLGSQTLDNIKMDRENVKA